MTGYILKTCAGLAGILILIAGFYFQAGIRLHYPAYDPTLFIAGLVFIMGSSYAVMSRNFVVILIVIMATVAIPFMGRWIMLYWPF